MLSRLELQEILLQGYQNVPHPYSIWLGDGTTQLLNDDGSVPYVRWVSDQDQRLLALDESYQLTTEVYKVSLVADAPPSDSQQYWLSSNDGVNKVRLSFIRKQLKSAGTYWEILLKRN